MGIDAKDIQCFVWKIVRLSMNTCCRFAQKHPFVSGVVLLFFLLYLLLPSVFFFMIYSSPVIFCFTILIRIYLKTNRSQIQNDKRDDEKSSVESQSIEADTDVSRNEDRPAVHGQLSRRKNVKKKNKEWDAEGVNKEKGTTLATAPDASIVENQKAMTEKKGSHSLDHGESSGRNISDAENIQAKDDLTGKSSLNEESSKGVTENNEINSLDRGESSSRNVSAGENIQAPDQSDSVLYSEPSMVDLILQKDFVEPSEKGTGGGEEEGEESSEDEEEVQQDGNNAVEWTADDQQNLMDLGDSELERNKRLESLIARRRARKLFKMANEKRGIESGSGPAGQMPGISISRNNLLNVPNNPDMDEGLQIPGSAPSVLLPTRNPFDIPYDPYEERPNLTDDSFNEEFSAANPKELLFCRHESFFLGPSFSLESQQDQHDSQFGPCGIDRRTAQGLRFARYRTISDMSAHDQLIDELLASQEEEGEALSHNVSATDLVELGSQSPKKLTKSEETKHGMEGIKGEEIENSAGRSEFQMETDSVRDNSSEPCSLASDEASELSFHANVSSNIGHLEPKVGKFRQLLSDRVKNSLTFTIPEGVALNGPSSYDSSPPAFDKQRMEDRLFYRDKGPCHSPGYSIASDLQVEVSELGSPPLPIDGTNSPPDAESSYDGDIEKEITSGSEEMWGASSHLSGVEENESRSREVNEVSEDDILEVGFSGIKQNLQNPITPSTLPAQIAKQDMSKTSSLSSSRTEMPEKEQIHLKDPSRLVCQNIKEVVQEAQKPYLSSDPLPPKNPEKTLPVMESVSHPPSEVYSETPEGVSNPPEKSVEVNAISQVDDELVHKNNDKDSLKSTEEKGGGSQISTNKEALMDLSQPAEKITSESSKDIDKTCDPPAEQETVIESGKQMEENKNPQFTEGDTPKLNEQEEVGSMPMTTEVQHEQNTAEVAVPGVNQSFDNPDVSAPPPAFMAEQLSTNSSSCSSPRSVLPGKIQTDQIPTSSFHQQIPNDVPQSIVNDLVSNNPLVEVSPESLILVTAPESSQHLVAEPIDRSSTSSGFRQSEEPSAGVESKSDALIILEAAAVQSESAGNTHSRPIDDVEEKSQILPEHTAGMSSSKLEERVANSNAPETMVKEEETPNSPGKSTREANLSNSINHPVLNENADKTTEKGSKGKSWLSITKEEIVKPLKPAEVSASKVIEDSGEYQGKLTENKAFVGPSKSFDEDESSRVVKDSEHSIQVPKLADSESNLEASKGSQAKTAVEKEPSNPPPEKSTVDDGTTHNVNETVADRMKNKKSLIDQENVADQPKPGKATAEIDMKQNVKVTVTDEIIDKKRLIDHENFTEQPKSDKAEVDIKNSVNQAKELSSKENLIHQENVADQPKSGKAAAEVDFKSNATEAVGNEMSNKTSLIDLEHVSGQLKHDTAATAVDIKHSVNKTAENGMNRKKSLIYQENVADQLRPGTDNDNSLKAIEDDKHEPKDLKKDDVKMDNLTNHNIIADQSTPTESEVRETKNETYTTA